MNAPFSVRSKLIAASVMSALMPAFIMLHDIGTRSPVDAAVRIASVALSVPIAYLGVFRSVQLQLRWGWGLAVCAPLLATLCIFDYRGPELAFGLLAMVAAVAGAYLLLLDAGIRDHRERLKRSHAA